MEFSEMENLENKNEKIILSVDIHIIIAINRKSFTSLLIFRMF